MWNATGTPACSTRNFLDCGTGILPVYDIKKVVNIIQANVYFPHRTKHNLLKNQKHEH